MRIQLMSDVHVEFHGHPTRFFDQLDITADVLVLAGDIVPIKKPWAYDTLAAAAQKVPHLLYVLGNHEFYGSNPQEVETKLGSLQAAITNLWVLERDSITIDNVTFAGATTWFAETHDTGRYRTAMNDFYQIRGFEDWVYGQHRAALDFWRDCDADIWITHHLPSESCVVPQYKGDPLNCFFVSNGMEAIVKQQQPNYLFCGHSHSSINTTISTTKVLSNPYGYELNSLNRAFKSNYVLEV